ncbi:UDP-glucuronosyl/UDP-glucosyltransferase [Macleaya cordata]|uniref:Glycosyltransferase n=1 Tax=Macleaya cordata TaxID=56857 RepID=A0A200PS56_MACCD|nr:UDP-glucuronosyl/UDP-glucosyltransferase [Macleaya cordata]
MEEETSYVAHVVVLPYQGQGHMNPMLQFSKRLAFKGLKVTVATTLSITKTMQAQVGSVMIESIYDDSNETGGFKERVEKLEASGSKNLTDLIKKHEGSRYPVKCLVYDANLGWPLNVAKQLGIAKAAFFTQSCSANGTYYLMQQEISGKLPSGPTVLMSGLQTQGLHKLPTFGLASGGISPILRHIFSQLSGPEEADWVLFNSFDSLEEEVVNWMAKIWSVKTIGPTVPSMYLDKKVEGDINYGFNIVRPKDDDVCMKWLDTKEPGSVVYVSFGSAAALKEEQMEELAMALMQNKSSFLWVVRASEEKKLPSKFLEEITSNKGLVVKWCPQLEVLAHNSVGCFLTHCGWNSTMEALSFGVPMVIMPQFLDQFTNAKFVEDIWGTGIRPKVDEKGIVRKEDLDLCIRDVMEGERGKEIKRNAAKWKKLAKDAVDEGGSSDKNINEIVARLKSM